MYNYELCIMNYELIFMSDIAIKVENLSKYYRLGVINNGTLIELNDKEQINKTVNQFLNVVNLSFRGSLVYRLVCLL